MCQWLEGHPLAHVYLWDSLTRSHGFGDLGRILKVTGRYEDVIFSLKMRYFVSPWFDCRQTCTGIPMKETKEISVGDLELIYKVKGGHKDVTFSLKMRYLLSHWLDCHQTCTAIPLG